VRSTYTRGARLAALAAVGCLALTACGDTSDKTSNSPEKGDEATGTPIHVGFMNTDQGAVAAPEATIGAKAAAKYLNEHGGLNGHRVDLVVCSTTGAPESSGKCANDLIAKKVSVVVMGLDLGADGALKPLKEAGIPIFGVNPSGTTLSGDPYATFTSAPAAFTYNGVWKVLKEAGAKKPVLISPDGGAAYKKLYDTVVIPSAKAAGLDLSYTLFNPASPDFAAAITAAKKKKRADAVYIAGAEGDCTNGIKTAKQLNFSGVIFGGSCSQFVKTLGSKAEGVYTLQYLLTAKTKDSAPADKKDQVQLYIDQMTAFGATDKIDTYATYGFASVMTLKDVLTGVTGEVTSATAKAALDAYKGDVFLSGPVDCTARPMPGGSCGTTIIALKVKADGSQEVLTGGFIDITQA
jgi:branched-chain amino acid transport system substrate-binding protein